MRSRDSSRAAWSAILIPLAVACGGGSQTTTESAETGGSGGAGQAGASSGGGAGVAGSASGGGTSGKGGSAGKGGAGVCGDGACNSGETWDSCAADCPAPAPIVWAKAGNCAASSVVYDGSGDATWVRSDSQQLVFSSCTLGNTSVDAKVGELSVTLGGKKTPAATVECAASGGGGCSFYWVNTAVQKAIDIAGTCSAATFTETQISPAPCGG